MLVSAAEELVLVATGGARASLVPDLPTALSPESAWKAKGRGAAKAGLPPAPSRGWGNECWALVVWRCGVGVLVLLLAACWPCRSSCADMGLAALCMKEDMVRARPAGQTGMARAKTASMAASRVAWEAWVQGRAGQEVCVCVCVCVCV